MIDVKFIEKLHTVRIELNFVCNALHFNPNPRLTKIECFFFYSNLGAPSDVLIEGKINGVECVLLARHGRKHSIMPSNINYRANIWALKNVGCTHVIASTATGSLQENIKPGDIVIIDNFIDRTTKRIQTFYDGKELSPFGVCHLPMEPAFCEKTRDVIIQTACDLGNERFVDYFGFNLSEK